MTEINLFRGRKVVCERNRRFRTTAAPTWRKFSLRGANFLARWRRCRSNFTKSSPHNQGRLAHKLNVKDQLTLSSTHSWSSHHWWKQINALSLFGLQAKLRYPLPFATVNNQISPCFDGFHPCSPPTSIRTLGNIKKSIAPWGYLLGV